MDLLVAFPGLPFPTCSQGTESQVTLCGRRSFLPAYMNYLWDPIVLLSQKRKTASYGGKVQRQPRTSHAQQLVFQDQPALVK